jgi:hypothetical protein
MCSICDSSFGPVATCLGTPTDKLHTCLCCNRDLGSGQHSLIFGCCFLVPLILFVNLLFPPFAYYIIWRVRSRESGVYNFNKLGCEFLLTTIYSSFFLVPGQIYVLYRFLKDVRFDKWQ